MTGALAKAFAVGMLLITAEANASALSKCTDEAFALQVAGDVRAMCKNGSSEVIRQRTLFCCDGLKIVSKVTADEDNIIDDDGWLINHCPDNKASAFVYVGRGAEDGPGLLDFDGCFRKDADFYIPQ